MRGLGIFGTSGFAREVADIAAELGFQPVFIAKDPSELKSWEFPEQVVLESDIDRLQVEGFALGIGDNAIRGKVAARYLTRLNFVNLIHPSASFGRNQLEEVHRRQGVIICAGVRFTNAILIGDFSIFNLNATIGHDVVIEPFVNIAPGACISGNVRLGRGCWIGTGAVVNQGSGQEKLTIGAGTTIGSGSVVVRHCDEGAVYVGVPAKRIK